MFVTTEHKWTYIGIGKPKLYKKALEEGHPSLIKRNMFNSNTKTVFLIPSSLCSVLL